MAAPGQTRAQSLEEIIVLITASIALKKPISAVYDDHQRSLCPHIIGWNKEGSLQALCYQYAGSSGSGLERAPSPANWRCLAVTKLSAVQLTSGHWHSGQKHSRPQACIQTVLLDTEKLPA